MDDLIVEFLTETNESLDELDADLVTFEQTPNDKDLLGKIFRLMHTIKGTCGFLNLPRLEKVAHHAENVLGRFRDGDLEVTAQYVTLVFESIDRIKFIVGEIEESGKEPQGDDKGLIGRLDAAYEGKDISNENDLKKDTLPNEKTKTAKAPAKEAAQEIVVEQSAPAPAEAHVAEEDKNFTVDIPVNKELAPGEVSLEELEAAFASAPGMAGIVNPADIEKMANEQEQKFIEEKEEAEETSIGKSEAKAKTSQTLRVNVDVLEGLMTLVSELVLTRNQLLQIVRAEGETSFTGPLQRLNLVVSDLQEGVMKTRMQPIGNAWSKLPRIIRDLAIELNKKINLDMRGQDTELDRQVLEMIKDPLTHMVRNSGDHGIESPAERLALGKPEAGNIVLEAYHEGGHIIIKISDDGKGLPEAKIREKIISNGLATKDELAEMSVQQVQQFIFKPGFSTAEKVTSVSGRGVGMDVVRTNIEKIGGSVDLKSVEGRGSVFTIKIPLTLAIVHALIVESAGERFAIPQLSVSELVMVSEHGDNRIEYIKGAPVFRLRDRLLPLVSLDEVLGLKTKSNIDKIKEKNKKPSKKTGKALSSNNDANEILDETEQEESQAAETKAKQSKSSSGKKSIYSEKTSRNLYIVIAEVGGYEFGIIVDRVFDTEEIVVKPVAQMLKSIKLFSGNTILGDGSVIMILDPNGIANASGGIDNAEHQIANQQEGATHHPDSEKKTSLLLFNVGDRTPKAVPLSLVARLENIKAENIEYSSGKMMVQYRGTLMPLIPFNSSVQLKENSKEGNPVLVFADDSRSMGIIVNEIVDIIEEHIDVKLQSNQTGMLGSAIINGHATDVVDVGYYLSSVNGDWFKDHDDTPFGEAGEKGGHEKPKKRVLLIDDSPFFRNMLTPLLSVAGYEVTTLAKPADALQMREDGLSFDVIISDIEMPDMDGFEFARQVKHQDSKWCNTPMVALSSHATPKDIEKGMQVGFQNYVAKFDKDTLLNTLYQTLTGHS